MITAPSPPIRHSSCRTTTTVAFAAVSGLVHLVPDPCEVSAPLGQHVREVLTRRTAGWQPPRGGLHRLLKLGEEETRRIVWMLPEASKRRYIAKHMPDADAAMTDQLIAYFKRQAEADPYTLLQPLPVGEAGAQYQISTRAWIYTCRRRDLAVTRCSGCS